MSRKDNYQLSIKFAVGMYFTIIVPSDLTFYELHLIIMGCTNFIDYHLHVFYFCGMEIEVDDEEATGNTFASWRCNEYKTSLYKLFPDYGTCTYLYDFGDSWEFKITLQKIIPSPCEYRVTKHKGVFPPEDSRGLPWSKEEYLKVLKKTENKRDDIEEWLADNGYLFDKEISLDDLTFYLQDIVESREALKKDKKNKQLISSK
jgi:hypothetical protein